ncbi:MAG: hypothetical protein BMS9Abin23_0728 [Thermodesulfobacteriota bacterium]|nr:MAG: hypothetical protein BMS9Abin23_0728 [Thermodesulfobacteriota bacterium]
MDKLRCHGCGRELESGALKYVIEIKSFADFDGYLEEYEGDIEEGINMLLDAMENMDVKKLEEDISKDIVLILCKKCRDNFMNDPLQTGTTFLQGEDIKHMLH